MPCEGSAIIGSARAPSPRGSKPELDGTRYLALLYTNIVEYSGESRDRRITQLRKGILELAVMGVLYHEKHYGYSLVRVLCERGSISLKDGTIYPILARLDRDGLVARNGWNPTKDLRASTTR